MGAQEGRVGESRRGGLEFGTVGKGRPGQLSTGAGTSRRQEGTRREVGPTHSSYWHLSTHSTARPHQRPFLQLHSKAQSLTSHTRVCKPSVRNQRGARRREPRRARTGNHRTLPHRISLAQSYRGRQRRGGRTPGSVDGLVAAHVERDEQPTARPISLSLHLPCALPQERERTHEPQASLQLDRNRVSTRGRAGREGEGGPEGETSVLGGRLRGGDRGKVGHWSGSRGLCASRCVREGAASERCSKAKDGSSLAPCPPTDDIRPPDPPSSLLTHLQTRSRLALHPAPPTLLALAPPPSPNPSPASYAAQTAPACRPPPSLDPSRLGLPRRPRRASRHHGRRAGLPCCCPDRHRRFEGQGRRGPDRCEWARARRARRGRCEGEGGTVLCRQDARRD